ncbi:MAG: phosphodiester glycosidase family protein [Oscillospiraceae bacterium]|nr:phosphodiester glycosidase family protein [Oscillospiraceae bacterium]
MKKTRRNKRAAGGSAVLRTAGRAGFFILWTLILTVAVLFGVIYVMEKGPSPTLTATFCRSMRETSAIRWIPNIFLTDEEIDALKSEDTQDEETAPVNTSLIHIAAGAERQADDGEPALQLIEIANGTVKGKLLIVKDPSRVILGTSNNLGRQAGLQLTALVANYNGVAGINAGGFNDENGLGDGGTPQGLVITQGQLAWGNEGSTYNVIGFDRDNILHVGRMTARQAMADGVVNAVSFVTHDGLASALIINGEVQTKNLVSGVNPRTAIGQRADGAVLLLVLDGRSINTLGATMENTCDIMLQYGAVNAGNLDGGSSSVMVYDGEIINNCASVTGPRNIPTAFVVLPEEAAHG